MGCSLVRRERVLNCAWHYTITARTAVLFPGRRIIFVASATLFPLHPNLCSQKHTAMYANAIMCQSLVFAARIQLKCTHSHRWHSMLVRFSRFSQAMFVFWFPFVGPIGMLENILSHTICILFGIHDAHRHGCVRNTQHNMMAK